MMVNDHGRRRRKYDDDNYTPKNSLNLDVFKKDSVDLSYMHSPIVNYPLSPTGRIECDADGNDNDNDGQQERKKSTMSPSPTPTITFHLPRYTVTKRQWM